jgi:hypothetical protein
MLTIPEKRGAKYSHEISEGGEVNPLALASIVVFGVMGLGSSLFCRAIWLWCDFQEGNEIDWKRQALLAFLVPGAYIIAMVEVMSCTGILFVP